MKIRGTHRLISFFKQRYETGNIKTNKKKKKTGKTILSSNQTLIWDTLRSVGFKSPVHGYGKLLRN